MQISMVKTLPIAFGSFFLLHVATAHGAVTPSKQTDVLQTSKGPLRITPLYHGSVMLEFDGKVIHIDPWSQADYAGIPQADFILMTHSHADHMDAPLINKLKKPTTLIVSAPAVADTLNGACGIVESIANGEKKTFERSRSGRRFACARLRVCGNGGMFGSQGGPCDPSKKNHARRTRAS